MLGDQLARRGGTDAHSFALEALEATEVETGTRGLDPYETAEAIDAARRHFRRSRSSGSTGVPRVSVVIPTLNEALNIPHVLAELPACVHEVVIVDGLSTDGTPEAALEARPDAKIVHQRGRGKGDAMRCGFEASTGDILVMMDADGSADPGEIPAFIEALLHGADFAKGTRFRSGGAARTSPACAEPATGS